MDTIIWLAIANALIWCGIGGYIAFLASSQRRIAQRLNHLELLRNAEPPK